MYQRLLTLGLSLTALSLRVGHLQKIKHQSSYSKCLKNMNISSGKTDIMEKNRPASTERVNFENLANNFVFVYVLSFILITVII